MNRIGIKIECEITLDGYPIHKINTKDDFLVEDGMKTIVEFIQNPFLKKMMEITLANRAKRGKSKKVTFDNSLPEEDRVSVLRNRKN